MGYDNLTKTEFLRYLDAPLHLWAAAHGKLQQAEPPAMQLQLVAQGQEVETLAGIFLSHRAGTAEVQRQVPFPDGPFEARADFLVHDPKNQAYDLYEVKSSTSVKKERRYDLAFQALAAEPNYPLREVYLVFVDREYVRQGELDPLQMFVVESLTEAVLACKEEVRLLRAQALEAMRKDSPGGIPGCLDPRTCPCPALCHPDLPPNPIFDLTRIGKKAADLQALGVRAIEEIPPDFPLSAAQRAQVELVKAGQPKIDRPAIRKFLAGLQYPLYFLDYETVNPAIPLYDGYHPYDLVVFQYSLHVLERETAEVRHSDELVLDPADPAPRIAESLGQALGPAGSVIAWNMSFEARCNRTLARQAPQWADFFEGVNARLVDLMEPFKNGGYQHPDFRGSASLKSVLPVLVPDMRYESLAIQDGEQAMQAWWEIVSGGANPQRRVKLEAALREYCAQDTYALVRLWRALAAEDK